MKNELAVVLVSGGMDSCVTAAIANRSHRLAFLHVNYGQRTEGRELLSFNEIADFYKAEKRLIVSIEHLKVIGGSALTDINIPVPETGHSQSAIRNPQSAIPVTYVPFRNAHLLSIATSWSEVIGARWIYIGAVEEDSSGYPDCREVFYQAFNKVIETGTRPETRIEIATPLIHMKKAEIVKQGRELGAPLHLTWSCYQDNEKACGKCESCLFRLKGFRDAGVTDPIPYR
ncbi:MAG: 7-cyano-7-deazaguanine synthase QueC [Nitrospirota bacterium]|nr:7-cyano-7-deazaguanine synthase QueC [Nitrospirota bacterium]